MDGSEETTAGGAEAAVRALLELMARLRDPHHGCPWDRAQDFRSVAPFTVEEAHELADAIARGEPRAVEDELGDLLFQVVFHARIAEEAGLFDFTRVAETIHRKMVRRHPHVFGDADTPVRSWEAIKAEERAARGEGAPDSALDGVSPGLPGLQAAVKLTRRASRAGFDWDDAGGVIAKIREELAELEEARAAGDADAVRGEYGDVLFACANLGRHLGLDPEMTLREGNTKFRRRFSAMEEILQARHTALEGASMATLEAAWTEAKGREQEHGEGRE